MIVGAFLILAQGIQKCLEIAYTTWGWNPAITVAFGTGISAIILVYWAIKIHKD